MCPIPVALASEDARSAGPNYNTCFTCTRLGASTFLIIEDDKWDKEPYIYVKINLSFLVLIDTGCGGAAKNEAAEFTSLREYLRHFQSQTTKSQPLNPGSKKSYIVVCTHCHFDHIGNAPSTPLSTVGS
jgi:glyoxylase-like metal-dependent hydrolase (beta-lactamase superfamily II)